MSRILIVFGTKVDKILDKCAECPMRDYSRCFLTNKETVWTEPYDKFPKFCPLPEVPDNPKKQEVKRKGIVIDGVRYL